MPARERSRTFRRALLGSDRKGMNAVDAASLDNKASEEQSDDTGFPVCAEVAAAAS